MKKIVCLFIILSMIIMTGCHSGQVKITSNPDDYEGRMYEEVEKELKDQGFKNVKTAKIEDLITGWLTKDGEVDKVTIDGKDSYKSGEWIDKDAKVIIFYHTFPPKKDKPKEYYTEPETEPENETTNDHDKTREYDCGETAHFNGYNITIDNPSDIIVYNGEYYFVVPIRIECNDEDMKFGRENFLGVGEYESYITYDIKGSLPEEVEIKKGDYYEGSFLADPKCTTYKYDQEKGFFGSDYNDSTWKIDEEKRTVLIEKGKKKLKKHIKKLQSETIESHSPEGIASHELGSIIKATVYYRHPHKSHISAYSGFPRVVTVAFEESGDGDFLVSMKKEDYKKLKNYPENTRITIKGELAVLGYDSEDLGFTYYPLLKDTVLVN